MTKLNTTLKPKKAKAIAALTLMLGSTLSMADVDTQNYSWLPYTDYGYVGVNVGRTDLKSIDCTPGYKCDDSDVGFKIYTGGQVSRVFGVELGYVNIGSFDSDGGHKRGEGADFHLLGNIPLGKAANIYGKVGGIYGWTSTTADAPGAADGHKREFNWAYGAGAQFEIAKQWAIRADWDQYRLKFADGRENVSLYSLGTIYKF